MVFLCRNVFKDAYKTNQRLPSIWKVNSIYKLWNMNAAQSGGHTGGGGVGKKGSQMEVWCMYNLLICILSTINGTCKIFSILGIGGHYKWPPKLAWYIYCPTSHSHRFQFNHILHFLVDTRYWHNYHVYFYCDNIKITQFGVLKSLLIKHWQSNGIHIF